MKAKAEVKRKSTSNQKERELVLWPRVDLQLLAGLGQASMSMAEPENTIVRYYCIKFILGEKSIISVQGIYILRSYVLVSCNPLTWKCNLLSPKEYFCDSWLRQTSFLKISPDL